MENKTFKILVIDDLQDNLITLNALIRDAFPKADVFKAQNGKTGLELAAKKVPDVILLDILMPGMDGYEVCQKLKADKNLCDIPVVFVTAIENNKEALVKALESGGEAFLTKPIDEIELTAQIRAMLKIKEANDAKKDEKVRLEKLVEERSKELVQELDAHKKTLQDLRKKEDEKSTILQTALDGFWIVDKQGKFIEVNDAACKMIGYSQEEMLKMSIQDIESKETANETANHIKSVIKGGSARFESKHRTKKGRIIDVEISTTWVNSQNIFFAFLNDITQSKLAEEALRENEEKFRNLYKNSPFGIVICEMLTDEKGNYNDFIHLEANPSTGTNTGFDITDFVGSKASEMVDTKTLTELVDMYGKVVQSGRPVNYEQYFDIYDRTLEVTAFHLYKNFFIINFINITDRKQAEERILQQQYFLKKSQELGKIGTWELDLKENILRWTDENCRIFGMPPGSVVNYEIFISKVHPDDREYVNREWMAGVAGKPYDIEHRLLIDGVTTWVREKADITFDENRVAVSAIGFTQDITYRKQAEEKLKESEERFRNLVDTVNSGVAIYKVMNDGKSGSDYIIQDFNKFALEHEKIKKEEVVGKSLKDIRPNIDEYGLIDVFRKVWQTGEPTLFPAKVYIDERYSNYYENRVFKLPSGEIVAIYDDVTERERARLALKESEERFHLAMNASNDGLFDWNLETNEIYYSPGWKKMIGYEDHELPNDFSVWENTTAPEDVKKSWELQQKLISKQIDRFVIEFKMKHKEGHWVDILSRARAIFNDNGKAIRIVGTHTDISERKQAAEAILELKNFNESIVTNLAEGIILENDDGIIQFANPAMVKMLGYKKGELEGKHWTSFVPDDQVKIVKNANNRRKKAKSDQYEMQLIRKDGERIFVLVGGVPNFNKGTYIGLLAAFTDITERKRAEEKLKATNQQLSASEQQLRVTNQQLVASEQATKESERKFRLMTENAIDCIWQMDLRLNFTYISPSVQEMFGFNQQEWIGSNLSSHTIRIDFFKMARKALKGIKNYKTFKHATFEANMLHKDKSTIPVEVNYRLIKNKKGLPIGLQGSTRNITERKQAETERVKINKRLKISTESARIGIWDLDLKKNVLSWDKRMFELYGIEPKNFDRAYETWKKGVHPDDIERSDKEVQAAIAGEKEFHTQFRVVWPDGQIRFIEAHAIVNRDADGTPKSMIGVNWDITESKRNEHIQTIIHNISNAVITSHSTENFLTFVKKELGKLIDTTNFFVALYDKKTDRISLPFHHDEKDTLTSFPAGKTLTNYVIKTGNPLLARKAMIEKLIHSGKVEQVGHLSQVWLGVPLKSENKITGIFAVQSYDNENAFDKVDLKMLEIISHQISLSLERLKAEEELKTALEKAQESEAKYRRIFEESKDVIFVSNPAGQILNINPAGIKLFGYASLEEMQSINIGKALYKNSEDRESYLQEIKKNGFVRDYELELKKKDGSGIIVLVTSTAVYDNKHKIIGYRSIMRDVTEKKRLEGQLIQSQKMEAVGRLAGGVAHDFNNMLGVILGHADMILEDMDPDQLLYADLTEIKKAGERSADLTRQLLAFARKQTIAPKVIDLNKTVEGMLKMLQRLIGEDIDLAWIPGQKVWPVNIDPAQIDQILANLCVNARDAIADIGKVTIETGNRIFDEEFCKKQADILPGEYVLLAVSDNGCGMDTETLENVFEPFFTTKELGKGTGLGLATVYGAVKQNNGFINIYSKPGQGASFKIYLPRHAARAAETKGSQTQAAERGSETILLVEDESAILKMTTRMLEQSGYRVLAAGTPGKAIALAREHIGEIHLLMTDVVMPEMNGRDLAKNLLSLYPNLKRLFMSGYTANVIAHHSVLDKGVHFIPKPFSKEELTVKVREALEG